MYYLVIDLEATCCDQESIPREEREIIEIGAVILNADTFALLDEFNTFVKPVRTPILTKFCTNLTSITQQDVENAPLFPEAMKTFQIWFSTYKDFIFCSWGDYDRRQFILDCDYHQIPYPLGPKHINLKQQFAKKQKLKRQCGMKKALHLAGIPLSGAHHRGIDDARNIAKLVPFVFGNEKIP